MCSHCKSNITPTALHHLPPLIKHRQMVLYISIFPVHLCIYTDRYIHVWVMKCYKYSVMSYEVHFLSLPSHSPKSEVSTVVSCPSRSSSHILQWRGVWRLVLVALDATAELWWFADFSPREAIYLASHRSCTPSVLSDFWISCLHQPEITLAKSRGCAAVMPHEI